MCVVNKRPNSVRYAQCFFLSAHTAIYLYCLYLAITTPFDALFDIVWWPLFAVDMPVLIIVFLDRMIVPTEIWYRLDHITGQIFTIHPFSTAGFWYYAILFLIVGTIWYYYLPVWIHKAYCRAKN